MTEHELERVEHGAHITWLSRVRPFFVDQNLAGKVDVANRRFVLDDPEKRKRYALGVDGLFRAKPSGVGP